MWQCRQCGYRDANSVSPYNMFYSLSNYKVLKKTPPVTHFNLLILPSSYNAYRSAYNYNN